MKTYISNSIDDTFDIAKEIASLVKAPCIILLNGDLGAGKTHFVKGFASALGYHEVVTSPTFTIMNEYFGGKFPIYHFDMYRLASMEDALNLGFGEYFDMKRLDGISLVEWPENVDGLFPENVIEVDIFKGQNEDERRIEVRGELCL